MAQVKVRFEALIKDTKGSGLTNPDKVAATELANPTPVKSRQTQRQPCNWCGGKFHNSDKCRSRQGRSGGYGGGGYGFNGGRGGGYGPGGHGGSGGGGGSGYGPGRGGPWYGQ